MSGSFFEWGLTAIVGLQAFEEEVSDSLSGLLRERWKSQLASRISLPVTILSINWSGVTSSLSTSPIF